MKKILIALGIVGAIIATIAYATDRQLSAPTGKMVLNGQDGVSIADSPSPTTNNNARLNLRSNTGSYIGMRIQNGVTGGRIFAASVNAIDIGSDTNPDGTGTFSSYAKWNTDGTYEFDVRTDSNCGQGNVCSGTWTATTDSCASCTGTGEDLESFMRVGNVTSYGLRISISSSSAANFQITIGGLPFNASSCQGTFDGGGINLDAAQCKVFRITNTTVGLECNTLDGTTVTSAQNLGGNFQCLD